VLSSPAAEYDAAIVADVTSLRLGIAEPFGVWCRSADARAGT